MINDVDNAFGGLVALAHSRERGAVDQRTSVSRSSSATLVIRAMSGGKRDVLGIPGESNAEYG